MMSKKKAFASALVALVVVCGLAASVISYDWGMDQGIEKVPFGLDGNGMLADNSINYQMFEVWGPVLLVLGTLMFGAIIAGVCISREERDKKEEEE